MEETINRALQLLDQLMDRPGLDIEAFKRVADICDEWSVDRRLVREKEAEMKERLRLQDDETSVAPLSPQFGQ